MEWSSRTLSLAGWNVLFDDTLPGNMCYSFPGKMDAFSAAGKEYLFHYKIRKEAVSEAWIQEIEKKTVRIWSEKNGFHPLHILRKESGDIYWVQRHKNGSIILCYEISRDWRTWTLIYDATDTCGRYSQEYVGRIFSYAVIPCGGLVLHGVLMEYKGKGIILSAPSGMGKTTHARMWRDREGALIINGDRSLCRKMNGEWTGFGMPWCGTSGEYINRRVPISLIVVLSQNEKNYAENLNPYLAMVHMYQNIVAPAWDKDMINQALDHFEHMIQKIPVVKLNCRPDEEAVEVLKAILNSRISL